VADIGEGGLILGKKEEIIEERKADRESKHHLPPLPS